MELLIPVAGIGVGIAVLFLRVRAAARRRSRIGAGETVRCRALLGVGEVRLCRGRLLLGPGTFTWSGGGELIDLASAQLLAAAVPGRMRQARPDDALLRLRLADGTQARLLLHEADAALVAQRLRESPAGDSHGHVAGPAAAPAPSPRRWPMVVLALAGLWLAAWAYLVVGGQTTEATVTGGDGVGSCDVTWTVEAGQQETSNIDCADEPTGAERRVWVLAPPLTGEAVDPAWTLGMVLVLGTSGVAVGSAGLWLGRRPRAKTEPAPAARGSVLPPLGEADVTPTFEAPPAVLTRLAPYATRQLPADGWQDPRRPHGATAPSLLRDLPQALLWPAFALGLVALLTAPAPYRWWVLQTSTTATAQAISTGEVAVDGPGPIPEEVTVEYVDANEARHRADVATIRELPTGAQVGIEYAVEAPGWARFDENGDGLDRSLLLAVLGTLAALGAATFRVLRARATTSAVRHARAQAARPALATLTADPDGQPLLLVCDPVTQPAEIHAVPLLAPLPNEVAAAFPSDAPLTVQAYGKLADGEPVVVDVPGIEGALHPSGPAWRPEADELLFLLDTAGALARSIEDEEQQGDDGQLPAAT